ncbi:hypothetical protein KDL01_32095 [Actinospica durhamensis]|uniref:Uncharacterized protein n=1 Tax=Actinospica durhamensis TaxID=1508375 RepID=A0A941IUS6_9ACTN|nr:hypothetical protein [Actinospica durhamensis]MBR7837958.1 hypothetical protein [Actinospica durhamensis]
MPFEAGEVRYDLVCGRRPDGHWHGSFIIRLDAEALRRLGLHPDQPTAVVTGASPPPWWHAAAENRSGGRLRARR